MWRWVAGILLFIGAGIGAWYVIKTPESIVSPIGKILEKPLEKYTIESLSRRIFEGSDIVLEDTIETTGSYTVRKFSFNSDGKRVTGLAHIPQSASEANKVPVVVQFRGYVDREKYTPGEGTKKSAEVFARNGFISLAPDFLGYGGSASPSADIFEERFETYTTALNLLASIKSLPMASSEKVGIWGHSNGGQIALTVLEVTQKSYPTTLWAPVSKPFPYSILYYTDEASDRGKLIRKRLAKFEESYDVELYAMVNYLDRITAPIQIHQGSADEPVPQKWSDELVSNLKIKNEKLKIEYFVYPGADHNMVGPPAGGWNTVVSRDIEFFRRNLK